MTVMDIRCSTSVAISMITYNPRRAHGDPSLVSVEPQGTWLLKVVVFVTSVLTPGDLSVGMGPPGAFIVVLTPGDLSVGTGPSGAGVVVVSIAICTVMPLGLKSLLLLF